MFLRHHFADRLERVRHAELQRARRVRFDRDRQEKEKREELADRAEDTALGFAAATAPIPAPPERVEAIDRELTELEVKIVKALLGNEKAIDAAQAQIAILLSQAHILPDGRRVFRTEDGTQVFDEFGEEVSGDDIDPSEIPDTAPTWEAFSQENERLQMLQQDRAELLDLQGRIDAARTEIAEGDISAERLDAIEADILNDLPPSLSSYLPESPTPTTTSPEPARTQHNSTETAKPLNTALERLDM